MIARLAVSTAACLLVATAAAAPLAEKKGELEALQGRIEILRKDLTKAEESHSDAADQLRDTEIAISLAKRRLRDLAEDHRAIADELSELDSQIRKLEQSTAGEQRSLARLLNRQYVGGDSDALRLMLAGKDPNQAARDRYFLTRLSVAKAALTRELRAVASQKRALRDQVKEREARIERIEAEQKAGHAQLLKEQQQRQALLQKIAGKIKTQRKEIGSLQRDQQRLSKLIEGLSRIARSKTTRPPAKVSPGDRRESPRDETAVKSAKPDAPVRDADPGQIGGSFGKLRGRLPYPVLGTLAGRFGSARGDTGGSWKGLFIRAGEGADVRVVAGGTVVFSDWLRGFGNLLIVDHGDDFLSIYAFNQSLLKAVGHEVKAGDAVATVGNSGGNTDSGLYFELRHQGQPFDPLKWLKR